MLKSNAFGAAFVGVFILYFPILVQAQSSQKLESILVKAPQP